MASDAELVAMIGREADERLLEDAVGALPPSIAPPPALGAESPARRPLLRGGAALTGVSLIGGIGLLLAALAELVSQGFGVGWVLAAVAGVLLIATHWGWVHVAELTATRLDARHRAPALEARRRWLEAIEPYTRHEVSTSVLEDGSIEILRCAHRPVPAGEGRFSFAREVELRERHDPDEPGAAVAERAELLRRAAAADTRREHARYQRAADAYRTTILASEEEQQRALARRAASRALSEAINENLREPPLVE